MKTILTISFLSLNLFSQGLEVATGEAYFIRTFSVLESIIDERNSETLALKRALDNIVTNKCRSEQFYFDRDFKFTFNTKTHKKTAQVRYKCYE